MAVGPESAARVARGVLELYLDAERIMLERVARRLARGITEEGWAEAKLAEISAMRRSAAAVVRGLESKVPAEVSAAVTKAYELGSTQASRDLAKAGLGAVQGAQPRAIRAIAERTADRLSSTHLRILRVADDAYRGAIARAAPQVLLGTETRREAAQLALNEFADAGVTGLVDDAGRSWNLASYAEMATRAASGQAAIVGHMGAIQAAGHDLVIVSDAPEECEICAPWEGQVLSISGNDARYPSVDEAEGDGLFHPNCRHDLDIFVEGVTRPKGRTEDPTGRLERAQQRYLERGVRQWKRREAVALSEDVAGGARGKVSEWQARLREFVAETDRKRLSYRESIGAAI